MQSNIPNGNDKQPEEMSPSDFHLAYGQAQASENSDKCLNAFQTIVAELEPHLPPDKLRLLSKIFELGEAAGRFKARKHLQEMTQAQLEGVREMMATLDKAWEKFSDDKLSADLMGQSIKLIREMYDR